MSVFTKFIKNDFMSFGMSFGIFVSVVFYMTYFIKLYLLIFLISMFSFFLMLRFLKYKKRNTFMSGFLVYVDDMWICCSNDEDPKENTNTFKEGFNGDWFYNILYNFIGCTGNITSYDYKIVGADDDKLKLPIIEVDKPKYLLIKTKTYKVNYSLSNKILKVVLKDEI